MTVQEVRASGLAYLELVTDLLQRVRLADADACVWEAADLQWWWRKPRRSDDVEQLFWVDEAGPVAAVIMTEWERAWGCDCLIVPSAPGVALSTVWARAVQVIEELRLGVVETLARDDDRALRDLVAGSGFSSGERSGTCWMDADQRSPVAALRDGYAFTDRAQTTDRPHPMRHRNGPEVETRLRQCSLYDPALDLAVQAPDGRIAGYALFWFDPVTQVGLVEPMRVEDEFQRRGLARAMLTEGLDRLSRRGARRLKVGYVTDAARALYVGAGFHDADSCHTYTWRPA
jgi:GNAT superfamily N-acetyltransferase